MMGTVGERIYKLRREKGLTQDALAAALNISRQAVSRWERNLSVPETGNLHDLTKLLGTTLDYLLLGETPSAIQDSLENKPIDASVNERPQQHPQQQYSQSLNLPYVSKTTASQGRLSRTMKSFVAFLIIAVLALGTSTTILGLKLSKKDALVHYELISQQDISTLIIDVPSTVEIVADDKYYMETISLYKWLYTDGAASLTYDESAREKIILNSSPNDVRLHIHSGKAPEKIEIINQKEYASLPIGESLTISGLDFPSTTLKIDDRFRNIKIENCNFAALELIIYHRDIELNSISVIGEAEFYGSNGAVEMQNCVFGGALTIDTSGAEILVKDTVFQGHCSAKTSNGDFLFERSTAEGIYLQIGNGNVFVEDFSVESFVFLSSTGGLKGSFKRIEQLLCLGSALLDVNITLPQKAEYYTFITKYKPQPYTASRQFLKYAGKDYALEENHTVGNGRARIKLEINTCQVDIRTAD